MAGTSAATSFESGTLSAGASFSFTFPATPGSVAYHCAIHGPSMAGQVQVVSGGPANANVVIGDNFFSPALVTIGPGGTVTWTNHGANDHIVFAPGGGAAQYCLNGRTYVGNTPTIVADVCAGTSSTWTLVTSGITSTPTRHAGSFRLRRVRPAMFIRSVRRNPLSSIPKLPSRYGSLAASKNCNAIRLLMHAASACAATFCSTAISKNT